jgi:ADP-ribose pyrophosphatase
VVSDERLGEGGFLRLRRTRLQNRYRDGGASAPYLCDFVERPRGLDAVALVLWHRGADGRAKVLIRACLRPPIQLGRAGHAVVHEPKPERPLLNPEVVAGLIEPGDEGLDGIRRRAALEAKEEAGYTIDPAEVELLGAPSLPVPGLLPELHHYAAYELFDPAAQGTMPGDGSPMEEGARQSFVDLDEAIARCVSGEIEDSKTELALRRLRERLYGGEASK